VVGAAIFAINSVGGNKDLIFGKVTRQSVTVTVNERGTLDSQANVDVVCRVKARTQGSTNATTIKRLLAEDGQKVHGPPRKLVAAASVGLGFSPYGPAALASIAPRFMPGELLMELDASGLEDQLKTQSITRDNAKLDWDKAESDLIITQNQNDSDIQAAMTTLKLAELDLKKYKEAEYPAALENVNNQLAQAEDRVNYSQRMVKKEFMSPSQLQADQFAYQKVKLDKKTLDYTYQRTVTDLQSKLDEAKRNLARVEETTRSKLNTAQKTRDSKRGVFEQEQRRCDEIRDEIRKCMVYADQTGMAIYVVPEQARFGIGGQQSVIMQGEAVREGQKMIKIPDLTKMLVTTKVHETLVRDVHVGQVATIRVDAESNRLLKGKVVSVATVDSKQDWMQADVKVYQTTININPEDTLPSLKPGMSADVRIEVSRTNGKVLTIPVEAIVDSMNDEKPYCFVKANGGEVKKRNVSVGISNGRIAEIKEGLEDGDEVVLNPGRLLSDSDKKKVTKAGSEDEGKQRGRGGDKAKDKAAGKPGPKGGASGGPTGPGGGPQASGGPQAGGGFKMSPEQEKAAEERWQKASKEERKQMLERMKPFFKQLPADVQGKMRQRAKEEGVTLD
jgi:multidrug resistance efflux pump